jgi:CheY-like chemotaxis protein
MGGFFGTGRRFMGPKKKILYVDDYADNRRLVKRLLEAEGYALVEAGSAHEALDKLQHENADLLLIDVNLPDVNGYALTAQIRRLPAYMQLPIIALTAADPGTDMNGSTSEGCDGFIQKPFDVDILLNEIKGKLHPDWRGAHRRVH